MFGHIFMNQHTAFFDTLADELVDRGYAILHQGVPTELCCQLRSRIQELDDEDFKRAGIGREQDHQINNQIRRDQIRWLSQNNPVENTYLKWMDTLRSALNQRLFMGLFDYEAHFAHYPVGAFYKRHVDAFKGRTNRVLTTVVYLNKDWLKEEGGELILYPETGDTPIECVLPESGTLVCFLSDRFPHEVLTAYRDRYSIAGWYRVNNTIGDQIDPPR